jgi:cobalt-precorrin 5A hydrolase/precorrin-3B C17-methyltransferase
LVLAVSVTERGRQLSARLPFERAHGGLARTVRDRWAVVDGFVLFAATGVAVRVVAPLLADKTVDPAVVCVDEAGRYAVALCGGHAGGANALARRVAALLDATPVVTTATDATGLPALDQLPGFVTVGDVAGVTTALLDGRRPALENPRRWPVPGWLLERRGDGPERIVVTDEVATAEPGVVLLHPPSLAVGVGTSSGAPPEEVIDLVGAALADAGLAAASVSSVATIDRRADEPAVSALGWPVRLFSADQLARVRVPTPSPVVAAAVGTPSVAEAAALLAAGPGADVVVPKRVGRSATVAVARRPRPPGRLTQIGRAHV